MRHAVCTLLKVINYVTAPTLAPLSPSFSLCSLIIWILKKATSYFAANDFSYECNIVIKSLHKSLCFKNTMTAFEILKTSKETYECFLVYKSKETYECFLVYKSMYILKVHLIHYKL